MRRLLPFREALVLKPRLPRFVSSLRSYPITFSRFSRRGFAEPPTRFAFASRGLRSDLSSPPDGAHHHRTNLIAPLLWGHAAQFKTLLRRRALTFHHLQLLSPAAVSRYPAPSRSVSQRAGAGPQPLSLRRRRLRGHARTYSPADQRTGGQDSLDRHTGSQTWICATHSGAGEEATQSGAGRPV